MCTPNAELILEYMFFFVVSACSKRKFKRNIPAYIQTCANQSLDMHTPTHMHVMQYRCLAGHTRVQTPTRVPLINPQLPYLAARYAQPARCCSCCCVSIIRTILKGHCPFKPHSTLRVVGNTSWIHGQHHQDKLVVSTHGAPASSQPAPSSTTALVWSPTDIVRRYAWRPYLPECGVKWVPVQGSETYP